MDLAKFRSKENIFIKKNFQINHYSKNYYFLCVNNYFIFLDHFFNLFFPFISI